MSHQTLPAKWVIKLTPENTDNIDKWMQRNLDFALAYPAFGGYLHVADNEFFLCSEVVAGYEPITDDQFKAMVEGESRPKWEGKLNQECQKMENAEERAENIKLVYDLLIELESYETAAEWKARHQDIWPVDYAAVVLEKAVAWVQSDDDSEYGASCELSRAVRNYLNNQK